MDIQLSWDLFIAVFFVIIIAYSFIIGVNNTAKVIIGTYISLVCADAIGEIFAHYFSGTAMFMQVAKEAAMSGEMEAVIFIKVMVFLVMLILFAVKGSFNVTAASGGVFKMIFGMAYAALSAGLIICSLLVLVSGVSILSGGGAISESLKGITDNSVFALNIVYYQNFWFSLPAFAFLIHSLKSGD